MGYAELLPSPPLRALVACTWAMAGPGGEHRVLPDGCIDILVLGHGRRAAARVVGTMTRAIVTPPQNGAILGIRFRPGEAARLLPAASHELTDDEAPLDALWGEDGLVLENALAALLDEAALAGLSAEQLLVRAASAVESALRTRLASHGEAIDARVRAAAGLLASGMSVRATAERVELSERQLTRRFTGRVGVAPKTFARVMRLQRAAGLIAEGRAPSEAASLAGYADQAHFTRDSVDLGGITPGGLARELSDSFKTELPVAS